MSRRSRTARTVAVSMVAGVLVPAVLALDTPTARAESQSPDDRRKDVIKVNVNGDSPKRKPRDRMHDLVGASASYGNRRLRMSATLRKLADDKTIIVWEVRTSKGKRALVRFTDRAGAPSVEFDQVPGDDPLTCDRVRFDRQPAKDRVVVTLARSCVDRAKWVTFGVLAGADTPHGTVLDDVRRAGRANFSRSRQGSRISHG